MAKTIIQSIGPLYGDVVNGTVFGRPNGSVFVPAQNTIKATLADTHQYVRQIPSGGSTFYDFCASDGAVLASNPANYLYFVAESQDIANYVVMQISEDAEFTAPFADKIFTAGIFNSREYYYKVTGSPVTITAGTTYYVRAVLMSASGEPVATSDTIEVEGVVIE